MKLPPFSGVCLSLFIFGLCPSFFYEDLLIEKRRNEKEHDKFDCLFVFYFYFI